MIKNKYYTPREAAELLGFSPDNIRRLILLGQLKAEKKGRCWLIWHKDLATVKRRRFNKPKDKET